MNKETKNKIYHYEVKPPMTGWQKIALSLDDMVPARFPEKLYDLEIMPPPQVWNKITGELDKKPLPLFVSKLHAYEVQPPAGIFNKIARDLDSGSNTIIADMPTRRPQSLWRYAAAAAIIGLIAFTAIWYSTGNSSREVVVNADQPSSVPEKQSTIQTESNSTESYTEPSYQPSPDEGAQSWVAEENYRRQYPTQDYYAAITTNDLRSRPVQLATSFSIDDLADNIQTSDNYRQISYNPSQVAEDNPYVMILQPDGSVVRISKKLSNMINCLNTEPTLNDIECRQRVDQWRKQIAQSPITPSPDNFLDMLDLINSIKENTP